MLSLEYFPKDQELLTEGVVGDRAFIIVKGEVEIKSRTNLYSLSVQAKKNQDFSVLCQLYRGSASGYGNASQTIMTSHIGVLGKGFWIGEESKLVKNAYSPGEHIEKPVPFSPMMAILDLYFLSPQLKKAQDEKAKREKDRLKMLTQQQQYGYNQGFNAQTEQEEPPRPSFYTAVARTDCLVFSVSLEHIDKLPGDVIDGVRETISRTKLQMIFERYAFLQNQADAFMANEGALKEQEIDATFRHIKGIYPVGTVKFQSRMRSEALKKAQMNPRILMMKKNDRIDRNSSMKNTYDMFRSTNPKLRKEAAEFLESLRDPFHFGKDPKVNNYNDIKELKQ